MRPSLRSWRVSSHKNEVSVIDYYPPVLPHLWDLAHVFMDLGKKAWTWIHLFSWMPFHGNGFKAIVYSQSLEQSSHSQVCVTVFFLCFVLLQCVMNALWLLCIFEVFICLWSIQMRALWMSGGLISTTSLSTGSQLKIKVSPDICTVLCFSEVHNLSEQSEEFCEYSLSYSALMKYRNCSRLTPQNIMEFIKSCNDLNTAVFLQKWCHFLYEDVIL